MNTPSTVLGLPLVLHVGFAGSRTLFDVAAHPTLDAEAFHRALEERLRDLIGRLVSRLELPSSTILCGISQIAVGADIVFSRAGRSLGMLQRVFLPQPRAAFLRAIGSGGTPDFSGDELSEAERILDESRVIQEIVVSHSDDRDTRFTDVNLEIARESDVIICMAREDAHRRSGGTLDLLDRGIRRGLLSVEIRVKVGPNLQPQWTETWHNAAGFVPPSIPHQFRTSPACLTGIPTVAAYCARLSEFAGTTARSRRNLFTRAALLIIGTHLFATICAVIALTLHGSRAIAELLVLELALLGVGFTVHLLLHRSHAAREWALSRLVAEIARSATAVSGVSGPLTHLFSLPLPPSLRSLVRTLDVLHLRDSRSISSLDLAQRRDSYVATRLLDPEGGQVAYYLRGLAAARTRLRLARATFYAATLCAFLATFAKLLVISHRIPLIAGLDPKAVESALGSLAIVLPVISVAALSLAASFDLEARVSTYEEMTAFLSRQGEHLRTAGSEREFTSLALETESRLLGETVNWHSRKSFSAVA